MTNKQNTNVETTAKQTPSCKPPPSSDIDVDDTATVPPGPATTTTMTTTTNTMIMMMMTMMMMTKKQTKKRLVDIDIGMPWTATTRTEMLSAKRHLQPCPLQSQ